MEFYDASSCTVESDSGFKNMVRGVWFGKTQRSMPQSQKSNNQSQRSNNQSQRSNNQIQRSNNQSQKSNQDEQRSYKTRTQSGREELSQKSRQDNYSRSQRSEAKNY